MKEYKKPKCVNINESRGFIPAAVAAGVAAVSSLSVTQAALVGAAAGLALAGNKDDIAISRNKLKAHIMV